MEEETVPLFPSSIHHPTSGHRDRRERGNITRRGNHSALTDDVEKAEITYNGGVATSLRCEDGVYRRLYQHTSSAHGSSPGSTTTSDEELDSPTPRIARIRNTSCRWFLFCSVIIFFLFLLYVPAYNNVAFRPDASTLHDRVYSDSFRGEMSERLLHKSDRGTVAGWSYNKSRNMRTYVLPDNVTVLNQPKSMCKLNHQQYLSSDEKEPDVFLLVIITSSLPNVKRRIAIRETWANQSNYELLAKRFRNISEHFANVNMTESLFSELGYSSSNVSLEDKRERLKREVTIDEDYQFNENVSVPMSDEENQVTAKMSDIDESQVNSLNEENMFKVIKDDGANSYKRNKALLESLTDESRKYKVGSAKQRKYTSTSNKHLDRSISGSISNYYTSHSITLAESAPCRPKRETASHTKSGTTDVEGAPSGLGGDKRAIYDEVQEETDQNVLGNFEGTEADPGDSPEDYDYPNEESNVMRIPRRGEASDPDEAVKKALQDIRNTLELSMKNEKLSLKYFSNKDAGTNKGEVNVDAKANDGKTEESRKSLVKELGLVNTKYLFLLGQSGNDNDTDLQNRIDEEASLYGDIIQEGFIDSYNNLTLKSVMLLKWVITNCEDNVHYIMKTDDDMFVNIPRLVEALKNKSDEYVSTSTVTQIKSAASRYAGEKVLMGDLICGARPISDMRSKWYSPTYMYSGKVYPKYLSGVGYVMSMGAARDLYHAALDTPLFHLEDIFITGMCSHKAGIRPQDHPGFSYAIRKSNLCVYTYSITAHQVTPSQLKQIFVMLMSNNTHSLEACEAKKLLNISIKTASSGMGSLTGKNFLGSPRNIITGLAGFGFADARKKKLKKINNGCS